MASPIIDVQQLNKRYKGGFSALEDVNLSIQKGEIFALLGPNGAGKTTLISMICGLTKISSGQIFVDGHDIERDYKKARDRIGLVPQELTTDAFETVWNTVNLSRGLFGKKKDPAFISDVLKRLSLLDKKDNQLRTLSGGMKRRVMIAKALSHEPQILFLDEPTAGVDVELRRDMWQQVRALQESGVTIILTTHYIEEAEQMADRIGIINHGRIILVEKKESLIKKLGKKQLILELGQALPQLPQSLSEFELEVRASGHQLVYSYDSMEEDNGICRLLQTLTAEDISFKDLNTKQSSLEEIFVSLVKRGSGNGETLQKDGS